MLNQTPEERDGSLWVMAKIAAGRDTDLIATLARKLDWEQEQATLKLTQRQFAKLMLCVIPRDEADEETIAYYVGMSAADLNRFLQRAVRTIAGPPQNEPPPEPAEAPVRKRSTRK